MALRNPFSTLGVITMTANISAAARMGTFAGNLVARVGRVETAVWRGVRRLGLPSQLCLVGMWCVRVGLGLALAFFSLFWLMVALGIVGVASLIADRSFSVAPGISQVLEECDHNGAYRDGVDGYGYYDNMGFKTRD
ncbi:hypothetical protein BJP27_06030 [Pseudomonas oryzihabitans]|nr:hypothetical protein BJP27_06030 [Pseudomonas psychrotolerans]